MRRGVPRTLDDIKHPGPIASQRRPSFPCHAEPVALSLSDGGGLLEKLGQWIEASGYQSAVLDLAGVELNAFDYVMPDRAIDDRHAAWYSDKQASEGSTLIEAVAILGLRDGKWFAHIHAYWHENGNVHLGHLLPDSVSLARKADLTGYGLTGAGFEAEYDLETEFTLFRIKPSQTIVAPSTPPNALITTLAPFEDLHDSICDLASTIGANTFKVVGLGSLAGAEFTSSPPMTGLISEILLQSGSGCEPNQGQRIQIRCIDLDGKLHQGVAQPGGCPTLVTCELLLISTD
ncbi:hypothetical protein [uncultured Roseibium sp.]|uniref:hypothetical protein n=1 Tax=uncultured Roseibium sp. TaxID=1936171 RepID=UPI0026022B63|nr:hypothetical protein [uncultured Roseibium sp.]